MISIAIVGRGNVAWHLSKAFQHIDNVEVIGYDSRDLKTLKKSDITILAVSDNAIPEVSEQIQNSLVVHTSGNTTMNALQNKTRKGVFYPLQSFTKGEMLNYKDIPFCIEAENTKDLELLQTLAYMITNKVYVITSEQRKKIHLAAVFVNNFVNHLYHIGEEICVKNNIPFDILYPLIDQTASKIKNCAPKNAQTGPAVRNDSLTIDNHISQLTSEQQIIYQILTKSIQNEY